MSRDPIAVDPDTSVARARALLEERNIRHLPVVAGRRLVGILSDRDLGIRARVLRAALREGAVRGLLDDDRPVATIMSSHVHTVTGDATIAQAARLMVARRIGALPVVDGDEMVGIITTVDCLLASLRHEGVPEP